jgi:carbon monoxide dehydrogenase subunit G
MFSIKRIVMLHFEGDQSFALPSAHVAGQLSDARFLVRCVPGIESVARNEARLAVFNLRPRLAFMRGNLEVTMALIDAASGSSARWSLVSKGIGSSSTVEALLTFAAQDGGTAVHWTADVQHLGGLLKAVPRGLIQAAAQKVIGEVWAAVAERLRQEQQQAAP